MCFTPDFIVTYVGSFRRCVFLVQVPLERGRPPPEPFIDISCGGWDMSDSPENHIYLWAVSQQGKVRGSFSNVDPLVRLLSNAKGKQQTMLMYIIYIL